MLQGMMGGGGMMDGGGMMGPGGNMGPPGNNMVSTCGNAFIFFFLIIFLDPTNSYYKYYIGFFTFSTVVLFTKSFSWSSSLVSSWGIIVSF